MCAANAADHLLPGQSFLGCPAEMERKERGGGHCTRGAPSPLSAPLPSWGTRIMGTQRRRRRSRRAADKAQVKRWGAGAQRRADTQAEPGARRGGHGEGSGWGHESHGSSSSADVGESTGILRGKAAERAPVAVEGGRKGNSQLGAGSLSAVRAGEGLTGCHRRGYKQNYHLLKRSESMRT